MVFPLVGWFIVLPLVAIVSLGAAVLALLRGEMRTAPIANRATSFEVSNVPLSDMR